MRPLWAPTRNLFMFLVFAIILICFIENMTLRVLRFIARPIFFVNLCDVFVSVILSIYRVHVFLKNRVRMFSDCLIEC